MILYTYESTFKRVVLNIYFQMSFLEKLHNINPYDLFITRDSRIN